MPLWKIPLVNFDFSARVMALFAHIMISPDAPGFEAPLLFWQVMALDPLLNCGRRENCDDPLPSMNTKCRPNPPNTTFTETTETPTDLPNPRRHIHAIPTLHTGTEMFFSSE